MLKWMKKVGKIGGYDSLTEYAESTESNKEIIYLNGNGPRMTPRCPRGAGSR